MTRPTYPKRLRVTRVFALAIILCSGHSVARAETTEGVARRDLSSKFSVDERAPEQRVPSPEQALKNPLEMGYFVMDLIARGEAATQRGDHEAAVRYYRAIAKAVPDRAVSYSKLCRAYEDLGDLPRASEACREALGRGGVTVSDYVKFVELSLQGKASLSQAQREEVEAVIAHVKSELKSAPKGAQTVAELECHLATRLEDEDRLESCVGRLSDLAPRAASTFTFRWALALARRDLDGAAHVIEEAKAAHLPWHATHDMEVKLLAERDKVSPFLTQVVGSALWLTIGLAAAAAILVTSVRRKSSGPRVA